MVLSVSYLEAVCENTNKEGAVLSKTEFALKWEDSVLLD